MSVFNQGFPQDNFGTTILNLQCRLAGTAVKLWFLLIVQCTDQYSPPLLLSCKRFNTWQHRFISRKDKLIQRTTNWSQMGRQSWKAPRMCHFPCVPFDMPLILIIIITFYSNLIELLKVENCNSTVKLNLITCPRCSFSH